MNIKADIHTQGVTDTIEMPFANPWDGFSLGAWQENVDIRDFIQKITIPMKAMQIF
jgi:hypothetical protein